MRPSFLELLACPACNSDLTLSGSDHTTSQLDSGELVCKDGHRYPVIHGIPRFVESELYVRNFGFEWNLHNRTQLDDSASDESERTFRAKTGFTPEQLRGKVVLDVGCGMGRFSDVASRWGATVVGVDLSSAVEAAQKNIGTRDNVHIAQADVFNLPFRSATFDYIFSIGVLHHTPDTKAAFDKLPPLLKRNGKIAIWLYASYNNLAWMFSNFYRRFTPKLPPRLLHTLSYAAIPIYHVQKIPVLGFWLRWVVLVSGHPKAEWRVLDTYDWYSPKYQWKHSYEEVFPWFEEQGLKDIRVLAFPVSLQGTKA